MSNQVQDGTINLFTKIEEDQMAEKVTTILSKRTFVGPVARIKMKAFLERSKDYGNKAAIGIEVDLPCYPNEIPETIKAIEDIINKTLEDKIVLLNEAVSKLSQNFGPMKLNTKKKPKKNGG